MTRNAGAAWGALGVAVLAMSLYAGTLRGPLIWDDHRVFETWLPHVTDTRSLFFPRGFTSELRGAYAHPIVTLSFRLDDDLARALWPADRVNEGRLVVCHVSNLLFYGLVTALVLVLQMMISRQVGARERGGGLLAGLVGAILFAAHPIHVESVAWISGRTDVLCALFWVSAVILYVAHLRSGRWIPFVLSLIAAFLAMLSKETGVGVLALLPLADLLLRPAPNRPEEGAEGSRSSSGLALRWGCLAALAVLFVAWRRLAYQGTGVSDIQGPALGLDHLAILVRAFGWYIAKFFRPWPQSAFVPTVPGGVYGLVGAGSLLFVGFVVVTSMARERWRRFGADLFLGAFTIVSIAPALAVAVLRVSETPLAERYLFIPSVGLSLLAGRWLVRLRNRMPRAWPERARNGALAILVLALAVPAGVATVKRARAWTDEVRFWSDAVRGAPGSGPPHLNLGEAYFDRGEPDRASAEFQRALETYEDREGRAKVYNNLGVLNARSGRCAEAERDFAAALREVPDYGAAYTNWAICDLIRASAMRGAPEQRQAVGQALERLRKALDLNPRDVKALFQYGKIIAALGQTREGTDRLREVIRLDPGSREAAYARKILAGIDRAGRPGRP